MELIRDNASRPNQGHPLARVIFRDLDGIINDAIVRQHQAVRTLLNHADEARKRAGQKFVAGRSEAKRRLDASITCIVLAQNSDLELHYLLGRERRRGHQARSEAQFVDCDLGAGNCCGGKQAGDDHSAAPTSANPHSHDALSAPDIA